MGREVEDAAHPSVQVAFAEEPGGRVPMERGAGLELGVVAGDVGVAVVWEGAGGISRDYSCGFERRT